MDITYNSDTDLLYIRFDARRQELRNERVSEDIVLDLGDDDRIVGIEILEASEKINLEGLLPPKIKVRKQRAAVA